MKIHCNRCQNKTNHAVLAQAEQKFEWDGPSVYLRQRYSIVECKGCEGISFLFQANNKLTFDNEGETLPFEASEDSASFPPRLFRRLPPWFDTIPDVEVITLLQEIYAALQNDSRRLAVMGMRTILDIVVTKAVSDLGDFAKKRQAYVALTGVGRRTDDAMKWVFEFGSAAIHRGFSPSQSQIIDAIEALEHILHEAQGTSRIEEGTPIRPKRP